MHHDLFLAQGIHGGFSSSPEISRGAPASQCSEPHPVPGQGDLRWRAWVSQCHRGLPGWCLFSWVASHPTCEDQSLELRATSLSRFFPLRSWAPPTPHLPRHWEPVSPPLTKPQESHLGPYRSSFHHHKQFILLAKTHLKLIYTGLRRCAWGCRRYAETSGLLLCDLSRVIQFPGQM